VVGAQVSGAIHSLWALEVGMVHSIQCSGSGVVLRLGIVGIPCMVTSLVTGGAGVSITAKAEPGVKAVVGV